MFISFLYLYLFQSYVKDTDRESEFQGDLLGIVHSVRTSTRKITRPKPSQQRALIHTATRQDICTPAHTNPLSTNDLYARSLIMITFPVKTRYTTPASMSCAHISFRAQIVISDMVSCVGKLHLCVCSSC